MYLIENQIETSNITSIMKNYFFK